MHDRNPEPGRGADCGRVLVPGTRDCTPGRAAAGKGHDGRGGDRRAISKTDSKRRI